MIDIDIRAEFKEIERSLAGLGLNITGAAASSCNDAARAVQKDVGAQIRKAIGTDVTVAGAKSAARIRKATRNTLVSSVTVSSKPLSLKAYNRRLFNHSGSRINGMIFGQPIRGDLVFRATKGRLNGHYFKKKYRYRTPGGGRKDTRVLSKFYGPPLPTVMTKDSFKRSSEIGYKTFLVRIDYHLGRLLRRLRLGR